MYFYFPGAAGALLGSDKACKCEYGWGARDFDVGDSRCQASCGDSILAYGVEQCDPGVIRPFEAGCDARCNLQSGYYWRYTIDMGSLQAGQATPICGDGLVVGNEECDFGVYPNTADWRSSRMPLLWTSSRIGDYFPPRDLWHQVPLPTYTAAIDTGCSNACRLEKGYVLRASDNMPVNHTPYHRSLFF